MAAQSDKHGKASKAGRNYRTNGENRGATPTTASATKYMRSGGAGRMAERKARRHGCGYPQFHRKPADYNHAHSIVAIVPKPVSAQAAEPIV